MATSFLRILFHAKIGYKLQYKPNRKSDLFGRTWLLMKDGHYMLSLWECHIIYDERKEA